MAKLKELSFEFRSGLFFGVVALVLSFLTGISAGVDFSVTVIRSLIMTPVFIAVGYGVIVVIQKKVPELYEILAGRNDVSVDAEDSVDINEGISGVDESDFSAEDGEDSIASTEPDENTGFTEFKNNDYDRLSSVDDSTPEGGPNTGNGKMGKHIIVEDQFNSYEPKLLAEAVRTMMSKDKD